MHQHSDHPDLIVIGAGAAGLAAARTARDLGLTVTVLEARNTIGGRAVTDTKSLGAPWDRGAHWLHHAETNFFSTYAERAGIPVDKSPSNAFLMSADGWAEPDEQDDLETYFDLAFDAIDEMGATGRDVAAGDAVPPHPCYRVMFDSWYAAVSGMEPARTSTLDHARYPDSEVNWRVTPGYGALLAHYGRDVPVTLSTPADRVRWGGGSIVVETRRGTLTAGAAIVTASTSALAHGVIRFDPPLPVATQEAIAAVPLGEAEKIAFAIEKGALDLPANSHVRYTHDTMEAVRFHVHPQGAPIVIAYAAGRFAAALEREGSAAMIAFAEERLTEIFGSGIRRALRGRATTHWISDPYIRGGYSCALPGRADARAVLSTAIGDRLFLAGEACVAHAYGTVHGAHESGVVAARLAAAALGKNAGR